MPEVPACLNRRYRALDNLIKELDTSSLNAIEPPSDASNAGIRLMCDFWNILKDDPDCNLTQEVQQCMGVAAPRTESTGHHYGMQRYMTYRGCCDDGSRRDKKKPSKYMEHKPRSPPTTSHALPASCQSSQELPLSKVLCNLKEAASFDQKCHIRVKELMKVQQELQEQIQVLEERERAGVELLKQADNMWLCMEETYKKKVSESLDRQKQLLQELKNVEGSANKWRKNERDLEFQIKNMTKVKTDIIESRNQKSNDVKIMDTEITNFQKRIDANSKDLENSKKSMISKREASDARLASIATEIAKVQERTQQEIAHKRSKEEEGAQYVRDARDDLQKICKVLLQKKIEHEDLRAERTAILEELDLLNVTADNCREKCKNKENALKNEIRTLTEEITTFKVKCIKCHVCTDTNDVRKLCTDCPKCMEERECQYGDGTCTVDPTMDCVCMGVKQKFLDNIFDNMYTVLERKSKTQPGKAVAESILNCLKRSTNGKLNSETRKILQDFVLSTVKKNLNLTIVGGAVKTRCELDPETYKQLMLCLNRVEVPKLLKQDQGTTKKDPCPRWGHSVECNCPKGPKDCACTKRAPPPPNDPAPCPPEEPDPGENITCPHKGGVCGPDCGMQGKLPPYADPDEIASWRPDPCSGPSCSYSKDMKPTQYVVGETRATETPKVKNVPEKAIVKPSPVHTPVKPVIKSSPMSTHSKASGRPSPVKPSVKPSPTNVPSKPCAKHSSTPPSEKIVMDTLASCACTGAIRKPCPCPRDRRRLPRERIIEEVMGRYNDIPPIAKVARSGASNISRETSRCECSDYTMQYYISKMNKLTPFCGCSASYISPYYYNRIPYVEKTRRKRAKNICRNCKCSSFSNTMRCGNVAMFAGFSNRAIYRPKSVKRTIKNDVQEILCPRLKTRDSKTERSLETSTSILCSSPPRLNSNTSLNTNEDTKSVDAHYIERNVCNMVKRCIKDIIVDPEDVKKNELLATDIEWITVEKLFKQVTSLTNVKHSNETVNEMEVKCEMLETEQQSIKSD